MSLPENMHTYFVQDLNNEAEMARLMIQDQLVTTEMGGPLAELDPQALHRILDIGCGPGGWLLEAATMWEHLVCKGVDVSWKMIEYAKAMASARNLGDRVEFRVMDATKSLDFPDDTFDLVNARFCSSFMQVVDWPAWLRDVLGRVICPGGMIRVIEAGVGHPTTSVACSRLNEMFALAMYRSGRDPSETSGMALLMPDLLEKAGYREIHTQAYTLAFRAGTMEGEAFFQNMRYVFQTGLPFLKKWDCSPPDYENIYQQALQDMQQHDFSASWHFITTWATKRED